MTMSGYSNAIVDVMLGWLKGLANWVLRLFNLAGSVTASPLLWLSQNWLKLLIVCLALGILLDSLIWLIRWRPYWVWFRKERVIVNDDKFFSSVDMDKASGRERDLDENWDEYDYVVASTVVRRQKASDGSRRGDDRVRNGGRPSEQKPRRRVDGTKVQRHGARSAASPVRRAPRSTEDRQTAAAHDDAVWQRQSEKREGTPDSIFAVKLNKPDVSDFYEDEVFNVANLPESTEYDEKRVKETR